jgi:signal transduction histidine kinase
MTAPERPISRGSDPLRPRARIIRAIGEDLISSEIIALVELIKNAYDADATHVSITFEPPLERGSGAIVVADDGHGMTLQVFRRAWLEPATASKRRGTTSPRGRRVTGEKGLGRFAAARLADRLRLRSTAGKRPRTVVAHIDWGSFRSERRYLDQIRCKWEVRHASRNSPTGTTLRLTCLRDSWADTSFRRLRAELARLVARPRNEDEFRIELRVPGEFREHAGVITPPALLGRPHYTLSGSVDGTGRLEAAGKVLTNPVTVAENIRLEGGREPSCGPFEFEIRVWDRDADTLGRLAADLRSTLRDLRRDLNEASGVSIYRDSFRVSPYGGPENDWLRLNLRRVQNPTMRLSNNQIVGSIFVSADGNPELRDQTNREGLVESAGFDDLKASVKAIIAKVEERRYAVRHPSERVDEHSPLFADLGVEDIAASFRERYPDDKEFRAFLEDRVRKAHSSIKRVQEVIVRYRRLATLGRLVDVILHDGRTPIASISNECELAQRGLKTEKDTDLAQGALYSRLETIARQTEVLSALFRRIAPFGGRKRGRPTKQPLERIIENAFELLGSQLEEAGIRTALPGTHTVVTVDAAEMQQIFVNLIDNAIYWLQKVPAARRAISVEVRHFNESAEILFADSGPGVPEDVERLIFDPYFTSKPDGVGLGLTIAGETAMDYGGSLELVPSRLLPGANFRITLHRRVSDTHEDEK